MAVREMSRGVPGEVRLEMAFKEEDVLLLVAKDKWILDEFGEPKKPSSFLEWARWFDVPGRRRVAETTTRDGIWISTVFLGIDHRFGDGHPILWETMVFRDENGCENWRYTTRGAALAGHNRVVELVEAQSSFECTWRRIEDGRVMRMSRLERAAVLRESKKRRRLGLPSIATATRRGVQDVLDQLSFVH